MSLLRIVPETPAGAPTTPGAPPANHPDAAEFGALNERFRMASPAQILTWAQERYGGRVGISTQFGASGCVILAIAAEQCPGMRAWFVDTDFHFPETLELLRTFEGRYGLEFEVYKTAMTPDAQAKAHGPELWKRDPDACCQIRKVVPTAFALGSMDAWVTGLRRDQGESRKDTPILEFVADERGTRRLKINPLAYWTRKEVWRYIHDHGVPYNPLMDRGYKSIGCTHCTRPVGEHEDERAGRWAGQGKTECGIHTFMPKEPA